MIRINGNLLLSCIIAIGFYRPLGPLGPGKRIEGGTSDRWRRADAGQKSRRPTGASPAAFPYADRHDDPAYGHPVRDRGRRVPGHRDRARRRPATTRALRNAAWYHLRRRPNATARGGRAAVPVAEPRRRRSLLVRGRTVPAGALRACPRQRDPRPDPLGPVDQDRARPQ